MKKVFIILLLAAHLSMTAKEPVEQRKNNLISDELTKRIQVLEQLAAESSSAGEQQNAIQVYEEILTILREENLISESIKYLQSISILLFNSGEYEEALQYQKNILKLAETLSDEESTAGSLSEIGFIYQSTADYDKAIEYYQKALMMYDKLNDKMNEALLLNRFGSIYKKIGEFDKALDYYQKALALRLDLNDNKGIASSYNNIATIYQEREEYKEAMELYFKALKINDEMNNQHWKSVNLNNIAFIYYLQGSYEQALDSYSRSLEIKRIRNDKRGILHTIGNISSVYRQMRNLEKAINFMEQSLNLAEEIGSKTHILNCYRDLAEYHALTGDYQTAYKYKNSYIALNDSVFTQEKIAKIAEIQTKYETEKKEQEIEILTKNNEIQELKIHSQKQMRNLLIVILVLFLLLVFFLIVRYRKNLIMNKILKLQKSELEEAKRQIEEININLEKRVETEVKIRQDEQQKAIEQSRLAALGELAAGIAHELNQPLHSIAFAIDNMSIALAEQDADEKYLQKKIANLSQDVERMKRIIGHIRTFSRKQLETEKEAFNINQSIANALDMINEQYAQHRIRVQFTAAPDLPETMGNLYRFEQVVLILLSNGKDAVEEKSKSAEEEYQMKISIKTYLAEKDICLEFADNGSGISAENLEKVFNPFFTTKQPGMGTGLGLSIAYGIIIDMDGRIEIESDLQKGTKVLISLPAKK